VFLQKRHAGPGRQVFASDLRRGGRRVKLLAVLPDLALPVLPVGLTAHLKLRACRRLKRVFNALTEAFRHWGGTSKRWPLPVFPRPPARARFGVRGAPHDGGLGGRSQPTQASTASHSGAVSTKPSVDSTIAVVVWASCVR